MIILAIDTSTMLGGIAILNDSNGLIAELKLNVKTTHSERLMTGIDFVLKQSGLSLTDINIFAIAIGPGSFTGLRIGLSTVKGLSYATGKPIVSVPSLEALAWNFPYSKYPVCPMFDARKKEVYTALFRWDNEGFVRLFNEVSIKVNNFIENIKPFLDKKIIFTGGGALLYKDTIIKLIGNKAIFAQPDKIIPSSANVAYIGLKKAQKREFSDPVDLIPLYIRRAEAEIKRDDRNPKDAAN